MRKIMILMLISFCFYLPRVKADLADETDAYINRIGTEINEFNQKLTSFNNYLNFETI